MRKVNKRSRDYYLEDYKSAIKHTKMNQFSTQYCVKMYNVRKGVGVFLLFTATLAGSCFVGF